MKQPGRLVVICVAFLMSLSASARTLTWTGGDSGSVDSSANWTDVDGLTNAVPQNFDRLIFSKGGTFTKQNSYLTLMGLSVTSPDPVTITGGKIDFESTSDGISVTGAGEVTFDSKLHCGYAAGTTFAFDVAPGSAVNLNGTISGSSNLKFDNDGTVNIRGDNTYNGNTLIYRGQIHVYSDNAFGSTNGTTTIDITKTATKINQLQVYFHGVTTPESFTMTTHKKLTGGTGYPIVFPDGTVTTFSNTVSHTAAVMYTLKGNAKVVHAGKFKFANPSFPFNSPSEIVFAGQGGQLWDDFMSGTGLLRVQSPIKMHGTASLTGSTQAKGYAFKVYAANPSRKLECENALCVDGVVCFPSWQAANSVLDICGHDQTFWYLSAGSSYKTGVLKSDDPATVHLTLCDRWSADAVSFYGSVEGPVTLSCEGAKPFTLYGVSPATGDFVLTNRANVTFGIGSKWGGSRIVVKGGSVLTFNESAFSDDVEVEIVDDEDESAPKSRLSMGLNMKVAKLTINGVEMPTGKTYGATGSGAEVEDEHFTGVGAVAVGEAEVEPTEVTWVGSGEDELFTTAENWDIAPKVPNFRNGLVSTTFAAGGTRALLAGDVFFRGVAFCGSGSGECFTLAADDSAPGAMLSLGASGISLAPSGDDLVHTNRVEVPVRFQSSPQILDIDSPKGVVAFNAPFSAESLEMTRRGAGTVLMNAPNDVVGKMTFNRGTTILKGGSTGLVRDDATNAVTLTVTTAGDNAISFGGGTYGSTFYVTRSVSPTLTFTYLAGATNVFARKVTQDDSYGTTRKYMKRSRTVYAGGLSMTGWRCWASLLGVGTEIAFTNAPVAVSSNARFWFCDDVYPGQGDGQPPADHHVRFQTAGNSAKPGVELTGSVTLDLEAPYALSTNTAASEIVFTTRRPGAKKVRPTIDLHGFDQGFGNMRPDLRMSTDYAISSNAVIRSDAPATAFTHQTVNSGDWHTTYEGAVSLEKSGTGTLTLAGTSPTTGCLGISDGVLAFAADVPEAGWTNCSAVAVSGGTLKVDRKGRLAKGAAYTLTGGTLEIAADVQLKGHSLTLPDGNGGTRTETVGVFSAANCPYISGEGELVLRMGTVILVK